MTVTAETPQTMADRAAKIHLRVMQAEWPTSREAQASIKWALAYLVEAEAERAAVLSGEIDPLALGDPDAGWWDDPEAAADQVTAERVLDAAKGLEKRLAEYRRREQAGWLAVVRRIAGRAA
jgi:hypothetical protein